MGVWGGLPPAEVPGTGQTAVAFLGLRRLSIAMSWLFSQSVRAHACWFPMKCSSVAHGTIRYKKL